MEKGDIIIYGFAFKKQKARVKEVVGDHLIVRHCDFGWLKDIIHENEVLSCKSKNTIIGRLRGKDRYREVSVR